MNFDWPMKSTNQEFRSNKQIPELQIQKQFWFFKGGNVDEFWPWDSNKVLNFWTVTNQELTKKQALFYVTDGEFVNNMNSNWELRER